MSNSADSSPEYMQEKEFYELRDLIVRTANTDVDDDDFEDYKEFRSERVRVSHCKSPTAGISLYSANVICGEIATQQIDVDPQVGSLIMKVKFDSTKEIFDSGYTFVTRTESSGGGLSELLERTRAQYIDVSKGLMGSFVTGLLAHVKHGLETGA